MSRFEDYIPIEDLLSRLLSFARVTITPLGGSRIMVSVMPEGHAPLWWYGIGAELNAALRVAYEESIRLRFLPGYEKDA